MSDTPYGSTGRRPPRRTGHEETWELLPWYVNETLEEAERSRVDEHLASCAICRQEVRYWGSFAELAREEGELEVSPGHGLARLRRRIASPPEDSEDRRGQHRKPERALGGWRATPGPVRWLVAAQLAGLLLLGGLLVRETGPADGPGVGAAAPTGFRTLADPAPAEASEPPLLRVVFASQTREREMRGVLVSVGGRLVAGPSPTGVYTVAIAPEDDVPTVLETLRSFPQVLLAEPAVVPGERP